MKIYFAADHAGFELKNTLLAYVRDELGYDVEDCGAFTFDETDDYPDWVSKASEYVAREPEDSRAIIIGASGQGEAMAANRFKGVRAAVFYGDGSGLQTDIKGNQFDILESTRKHNDANVLSLGARFISIEIAKRAVAKWLETDFNEDERHKRRINKLDVE